MGRSSELTDSTRVNRVRFLQHIFGVGPQKTITAGLVHASRVVAVSGENAGALIPECDGLITRTPGVALAITTEDCVPVFAWDKKETAVGIFHAGWRGIYAGILPRGITMLAGTFGVRPEELFLAFGPAIQACHYEVGSDVVSLFSRDCPAALIEREGKTYLDLVGILKAQAASRGILEENMRNLGECAFCAQESNGFKYFSWRRAHERDNNLLSVIMLAAE